MILTPPQQTVSRARRRHYECGANGASPDASKKPDSHPSGTRTPKKHYRKTPELPKESRLGDDKGLGGGLELPVKPLQDEAADT